MYNSQVHENIGPEQLTLKCILVKLLGFKEKEEIWGISRQKKSTWFIREKIRLSSEFLIATFYGRRK